VNSITPGQLKMLWALARRKGIAPEDLRTLTPAGSVSVLTKGQATELIDALIANRAPDYEHPARARAAAFWPQNPPTFARGGIEFADRKPVPLHSFVHHLPRSESGADQHFGTVLEQRASRRQPKTSPDCP
jgi:hypothetical protein